MQAYTIQRSGLPPLSFQGELIAEQEGKRQASREHNRYHDLAVYQTAGASYVLSITYATIWHGEVSHHFADVFQNEEQVASALLNYDPASHVQGFPPLPAFQSRQDRLLADIKARYEAQVSELLSCAEFCEKVE